MAYYAMYCYIRYHTDVVGSEAWFSDIKMTFELRLADKYMIVSGVGKVRSSQTLGSVT